MKFADQKAAVKGGMLVVPAVFLRDQKLEAWLDAVQAFASPAYDRFTPHPAGLREALRLWRRKFELMRTADAKCAVPASAASCLGPWPHRQRDV